METTYLKEEIAKCEDIHELVEQIFPLLESQQKQWKDKINQIISQSGYTKTRFSELCEVSRVALDKWCKGAIPKNRETFLKIGMAAGFNREQMDRFLQRYGRYPALYPKSLEDCICIFVLNENYGENAIGMYNYIRKRIQDNLTISPDEAIGDITTTRFDAKLSAIETVNELEQFISDNTTLFSKAYNKFYAYVWANICANYSDTVFELAEGQGWTSSLRQCVSAIRQKKWYPTRNKIISLGLHLSMDHEQINEMLALAHMEPLCAKNVFESVIIFILEDASLNDLMNTDADHYDPDDLCRYARNVLQQVDLPKIDGFLSELSEIDDLDFEP